MFWQLLANGIVTGSVIAIAAVGVTLIYGILRLVNFAYGDFMAFGALATYAFNGPLGLGMLLSTLLGMVATAVLSLGLDFALWRPLRARRAGDERPRQSSGIRAMCSTPVHSPVRSIRHYPTFRGRPA